MAHLLHDFVMLMLRNWAYKDLIITEEAWEEKNHAGSLLNNLTSYLHSVSQLWHAVSFPCDALLPSPPPLHGEAFTDCPPSSS